MVDLNSKGNPTASRLSTSLEDGVPCMAIFSIWVNAISKDIATLLKANTAMMSSKDMATYSRGVADAREFVSQSIQRVALAFPLEAQ